MANSIKSKTKFINLLAKAQSAHDDYVQSFLNGEDDADWALWYGMYMVEHGINEYLKKKTTVDELAARLSELADKHDNLDVANWQKFVAEKF